MKYSKIEIVEARRIKCQMIDIDYEDDDDRWWYGGEREEDCCQYIHPDKD